MYFLQSEYSSETSTHTYKTVWCQNPYECSLNKDNREYHTNQFHVSPCGLKEQRYVLALMWKKQFDYVITNQIAFTGEIFGFVARKC